MRGVPRLMGFALIAMLPLHGCCIHPPPDDQQTAANYQDEGESQDIPATITTDTKGHEDE